MKLIEVNQRLGNIGQNNSKEKEQNNVNRVEEKANILHFGVTPFILIPP
jgi:hypothetical protein